jgi:hypothetical protein
MGETSHRLPLTDHQGRTSHHDHAIVGGYVAQACGRLPANLQQGGGYQEFATLAEFVRPTGHEQHGREVDYDVFVNVRPPDPNHPHAIYESRDHDFQLRPGSRAVDVGCKLPNVNDGFAGTAPDLGALELGRPLPVSGPRHP